MFRQFVYVLKYNTSLFFSLMELETLVSFEWNTFWGIFRSVLCACSGSGKSSMNEICKTKKITLFCRWIELQKRRVGNFLIYNSNLLSLYTFMMDTTVLCDDYREKREKEEEELRIRRSSERSSRQENTFALWLKFTTQMDEFNCYWNVYIHHSHTMCLGNTIKCKPNQ